MLVPPIADGGTVSETPSFPTIPIAPIVQTFGYLNHVGIDFKVPVGSAVYADLDGYIVQEVNSEGVYGRYLMLEHVDGYVSLYGHLSEFKEKNNTWVASGSLIALSGGDPADNIDGDGWSSGAHLHWEVRPKGHTGTNRYNIDPMKYLMSFKRTAYKLAIVDSSDGLNVRAEPNKNATLIYSLYNRATVQIIEERFGWARLNSLRPEWVLLKWLDYEK